MNRLEGRHNDESILRFLAFTQAIEEAHATKEDLIASKSGDTGRPSQLP